MVLHVGHTHLVEPHGTAVGLAGTALGVGGRKQPGNGHRGVCRKTAIAGLGI